MDSQKIELRTLSDDQLDAVSGGDTETQHVDTENKKQADAIKGFQQMLQELP